MPKQTITNPSKNPRGGRFGKGKPSGSWVTPIEVKTIQSCDICSATTHLKERTVEGERMVACVGCLTSAGVDLSEWSTVKEPEVEASKTPTGKAVRGLVPGAGAWGPKGTLSRAIDKRQRHFRPCSYTGCEERVHKARVACNEHFLLLTDELQRGLLTSFGRPERREVYQRAERYLAIRARLALRIEEAAE